LISNSRERRLTYSERELTPQTSIFIGKGNRMEILVYTVILCGLAGVAVGWFSKRRIFGVLVQCALASFAVGTAIALTGGPPESFSPRHLLTGAIYYILPYLGLALMPALIGAILASVAKQKFSKPKENER
jgi:hypothetical protein